MIYLELFWCFFQVGLFSIGGGYVAIPLIQNQVVEIKHWLTLAELADVITIAEMTPGPIAINSSTFVGMKVAGLQGAVIATIGCVTPSCIIVLTLAFFFYRYKSLSIIQEILLTLRPAIIGLIASAGLSILLSAICTKSIIFGHYYKIDYIAIALFCISLFILKKFKINPIYIMLSFGVLGTVIYYLSMNNILF